MSGISLWIRSRSWRLWWYLRFGIRNGFQLRGMERFNGTHLNLRDGLCMGWIAASRWMDIQFNLTPCGNWESTTEDCKCTLPECHDGPHSWARRQEPPLGGAK